VRWRAGRLTGIAAIVAAASIPLGGEVPRVLLMALIAGVAAAVIADRRTVGTITVAAWIAVAVTTLIVETDPAAVGVVPAALLIAFAAVLGRGQRWMRTSPPATTRPPQAWRTPYRGRRTS